MTRIPQPNLNPDHIGLLEDTLQSPSAHNTQPWSIHPLKDGYSYELHYDQSDQLPPDYCDRDAYLTMGAFVETMTLQAPNHGLAVKFSPELSKNDRDMFIGTVTVGQAETDIQRDPLSDWIGERLTNRNKYSRTEPLTPALESALLSLGNTLVDPKVLERIVMEASRHAWSDRRYIKDLEYWYHPQESAVDGITPKPFNIDKASEVALKFAFWHGPFKSRLMQSSLAVADVGYFKHAVKASVLSAPDMQPESLFDAGRRLLRSWVNINGNGYSYQPFSVGIDEAEPAAMVAEATGVDNPIALYRIGKAKKQVRGRSPRKPLEQIVH